MLPMDLIMSNKIITSIVCFIIGFVAANAVDSHFNNVNNCDFYYSFLCEAEVNVETEE